MRRRSPTAFGLGIFIVCRVVLRIQALPEKFPQGEVRPVLILAIFLFLPLSKKLMDVNIIPVAIHTSISAFLAADYSKAACLSEAS
jgi:hypothetical protein